MAGKTISRIELYDAVNRKAGMSRSQSLAMADSVFKEITDTLAKGEAVKLSGFGSFIAPKKGKRMGRNAKNGAEAPIPPRRVLVFKPSAVLKRAVNGKRSSTKNPEVEQA